MGNFGDWQYRKLKGSLNYFYLNRSLTKRIDILILKILEPVTGCLMKERPIGVQQIAKYQNCSNWLLFQRNGERAKTSL